MMMNSLGLVRYRRRYRTMAGLHPWGANNLLMRYSGHTRSPTIGVLWDKGCPILPFRLTGLVQIEIYAPD